MYNQQILKVLVFIGCFSKCSSVVEDTTTPLSTPTTKTTTTTAPHQTSGPADPDVVNLPNTVTVSENSDIGTVIFTIQSAEQFELINLYPAVTSEAFQYDGRSKTVTLRNASLLDYNGDHRTFVLRFQQRFIQDRRRKREITGDLLLVIQLEDVKEEAGSLASFGFSGCCDDVDTLRWMVPVCTAVEFLAFLMCFAISMICFIKTNNRNAVEVFRDGK